MRKKLFIIFLAAIAGLLFFNTDLCLAVLNEPIVPDEEPLAGESNVLLRWSWDKNGGTLKQFKILYKEQNSTVWTARYPIAEEGDITYNLKGLLEGSYEWRIKAEAENPANDSAFVEGTSFETTTVPPPPPDFKENDENGFLQNMELKNPLSQDTFWDAMNAVLNFLILAVFAIAPILIIYAAFLMIFAAGDATKISRGKEIIFWTVIALVISLSAKILPAIIEGVFIN